MRIRSKENLLDALDKDFSWRRRELIEMKFCPTTPGQRRAILALLCAHFEGFIKKSSKYYLLYISSKNLPLSSLKTNFSACQLKAKIESSGKSVKNSVHRELIDGLFESQEKPFKIKEQMIDKHKIIDTGANPSSTVFKNLMDTLSLDFSIFSTKKHYIDDSLLKKRHCIVHGEYLQISEKEIEEIFAITLDIIETYRDIIYISADDNLFLRN